MKDRILIDKIIDMMIDKTIGIDSHKIIINREIINMKVNWMSTFLLMTLPNSKHNKFYPLYLNKG